MSGPAMVRPTLQDRRAEAKERLHRLFGKSMSELIGHKFIFLPHFVGNVDFSQTNASLLVGSIGGILLDPFSTGIVTSIVGEDGKCIYLRKENDEQLWFFTSLEGWRVQGEIRLLD